ncbi:MAG TPA: hypothetical protein VIP27_01195 [Variovorax sp.]
MKYLKSTAFFAMGFALTTGLFFLGLLAWGAEFEHAAPLITDGFFLAWLALSALVGSAGAWWTLRRRK